MREIAGRMSFFATWHSYYSIMKAISLIRNGIGYPTHDAATGGRSLKSRNGPTYGRTHPLMEMLTAFKKQDPSYLVFNKALMSLFKNDITGNSANEKSSNS